jgi:hypothetical protein
MSPDPFRRVSRRRVVQQHEREPAIRLRGMLVDVLPETTGERKGK